MAQEQTAEIIGTVTDDSGAPLPGVTVEAVSPSLVGKATAVTDVNGRYRLPALPSGTYKLTYTLENFTTVVRENIQLRVGQILTVNVTMKMTTIAETITVTAAVPLIDVKRSATATNITREMFQRLPRGRSFTSIVTLAPSVNYEPWLDGISVDGASGAENMFYIDGTDISDLSQGRNTLNVMFEHLEEIQVKQSGYEAEFGGSMGGVINVITRSGGNEFHGDLTFYYNGSDTNGTPPDRLRINPLDNTKAEYFRYDEKTYPGIWHNYEFGVNFGGYIMKDKLWFFGGFLPTYRTYDRTVTFITNKETQTVHGTRWWPRIQAKLTAQPFQSLRVSTSFANDLYKWKGDLPPEDGSGNPAKKWEDYGNTTPDMTFALRGDYIPNPNLIIGATAGYYYTNKDAKPLVKPTEPRWYFRTSNAVFTDIPSEYIRPRGWGNYGYADGYSTQKHLETRITSSIDATYYFDFYGEHTAKAGFLFARLDEDINSSYYYDYVNLWWDQTCRTVPGKAMRGKYGYYAIYYPVAVMPYGALGKAHSNRYAFYIQDSWTIAKKLTLNLGIRAEKEDIPSFFSAEQLQAVGKPIDFKPIVFDFSEKLAPRFGFSYDVFGDGSLKFFGSAGLYYDVMKLFTAIASFGGDKWVAYYYTLDTYDWKSIGGRYPNGNYPGTYIGSMDWRIPSLETYDPNVKPISQSELTLGAEKKIMENLSLRVRGVYKHLINTIEDIGVMTPAGEEYFNGNPGSDWVNSHYDPKYWKCPKAKRDYTALDIALEKRFSNNWMGGFSYTLSRLWGNYSGLASSDEYGRNSPNVERYFDLWFLSYTQDGKEAVGPLPTDRTHQFKLWGSYTFDFGKYGNLNLGLNAFAMSGTPVSTTFAMNNVQGYYPVGRGDLGRTPFITREDIYAEYNYKIAGKYTLQFNINVTNIFNFKTARQIYSYINQENAYLSDDEILAHFNYQDVIKAQNLMLDPRFKMKMDFMDPWEARVGVKFLF
jgi:hypothetical protein